MKFVNAAVAALALCMLVGCAKPLPADRMSYCGEWRGTGMVLLITAEGRVKYERKEGSMSKSIDAPLKEFEGNDFIVGVGFMNTKFVVRDPPHEVAGEWKMTVDGVELTRVRADVTGDEIQT